MRFATIEPGEARWAVVEANEPHDLYEQLGLGHNVDHGTVVPPHVLPSGFGIAIVVDGFGLFKPVAEQRYFAIARELYAGNAVLYGFDEAGECVDLAEMPIVIFMTAAGVEEAITRGQIDRPRTMVNGAQVWQWPDPP
jgi:hypothetical protein